MEGIECFNELEQEGWDESPTEGMALLKMFTKNEADKLEYKNYGLLHQKPFVLASVGRTVSHHLDRKSTEFNWGQMFASMQRYKDYNERAHRAQTLLENFLKIGEFRDTIMRAKNSEKFILDCEELLNKTIESLDTSCEGEFKCLEDFKKQLPNGCTSITSFFDSAKKMSPRQFTLLRIKPGFCCKSGNPLYPGVKDLRDSPTI